LYVAVPDGGKTAYRGADQPKAGADALFVPSIWFCDKSFVDAEQLKRQDPKVSFAESVIVSAVGHYISLAANIGIWLLWLISKLLVPLLGAGSFITNPIVRTGWPFIQGIANLGFIMALLFIAFATTLQLGEAYSPRKALPRLLGAALLINFSLVITGLLIDLSRLVMAALLTIFLQSGSLADLSFELLKSSNLITSNFDLQTYKTVGYAVFQGSTDSWRTVASTLQATLLIWGLVAGFIILAFGLVARYVMLILLLIVSPLAFLALALPNTKSLAEKWWAAFLKYVLYGPIAVFILILVVAASRGLASNTNLINRIDDTFLNSILNLLVLSAMLIAGSLAGKKLGYMGAGAAVDFVKNPRGAVDTIRKYAPLALAPGGPGGIAAAGAVRALASTKTGKNLADSAARVTGAKYISPYYWDERKKQIEKREGKKASKSFGTGRAQFDYASPLNRAKIEEEGRWADAVKKAPPDDPSNTALDPGRLRNLEVGKAVSKDQISAILTQLDSTRKEQQIANMVNNVEIVNNMELQQQNDLVSRLQNMIATPVPPGSTPAEAAEASRQRQVVTKTLSDFNDTIRRARDADKK
jgi:hypothetical protein